MRYGERLKTLCGLREALRVLDATRYLTGSAFVRIGVSLNQQLTEMYSGNPYDQFGVSS